MNNVSLPCSLMGSAHTYHSPTVCYAPPTISEVDWNIHAQMSAQRRRGEQEHRSSVWLVRHNGMWCISPQVKKGGGAEGWQGDRRDHRAWWTQPGDVRALCGYPDRQTVPIAYTHIHTHTHTHTRLHSCCGGRDKGIRWVIWKDLGSSGLVCM